MIKTHLDHWFIVWIILMQMLKVLEKKKNHADYTVGWSDLALFLDFRKPTHFCWSSIFLGTQFQKIGNFGRSRTRSTRSKVFIFKKSQGPQLFIFFLKIFKNLPDASKNNRQKENLKFFFLYWFLFSKNVKLFLICTRSK